MHTPLNMSKLLYCSGELFRKVRIVPKYYRTYLSKAYQCEDEWNKRLNSSLLKQINPDEMYFDIKKKLQAYGRFSAVDIDIFANVIKDKNNTEEILSLLKKLRQTTEASNILPSTHHAIIRFLLKFNLIECLFEVLNNRLMYGIFPDPLCYNLMMDTFIERKDFVSAARIATLLMLQEDFSNPISNALVLYSCHKYMLKPDEWKAPVIVKDEPEEEVKIRVKYLREPYFDEHFDLTEPSDLVGKTLYLFGKYTGNAEGRSCQIRGLILFKKYEKANALIEQWIKENQPDIIYKEIIPIILKDTAHIFEEEADDNIKKLKVLLEKLSSMMLKEGSLSDILENNVKIAIEKQENIDISQQCKNYVEWENNRLNIMQNHLLELKQQEKRKEFEEIKKEIENKETILTFFDKEEEIELKIERKLMLEKQKYGHISIKQVSLEEEYIPPDIKKRREI